MTLFKPLKGCDSHSEACLRSWLNQSYRGDFQILFGVRDAADPAAVLVRQILEESSASNAQLVVCPEELGPNAKVSTLAQLEPHADGEIWVVSDADVFAPSDLLEQIASSLASEDVGLVNCFYRLSTPATSAMHWEAAAVNADFWSQVLQARTLGPQEFALGAVMAAPRARITGMGGFSALVEFLADDYQLGRRVARSGGRIEPCRRVVECREPPAGWRSVWKHQVRWARTLRVCEPRRYLASVIANPTLWVLAWWAGTRPSWLLPITLIAARAGAAGWLAARLRGPSPQPSWAWATAAWAPLKDVLSFFVWSAAFLGSHVQWRGVHYRVGADGRLSYASV